MNDLLDIMEEETDAEEISNIEENRKRLEKKFTDIDNLWGHSKASYEGKKAAMTMLSTKTGLYAKIPLVCKGSQCPYKDTCELLKYGLYKEGEKCSYETALIEMYYAKYKEEFGLDEPDATFTDKMMVKDLIDCEIKMERSQALLISEQIPIKQEAVGVTENGDVIYKDEISKAYEIHERNAKRKERILDLMLATRAAKLKSKKDDGNNIRDIFEDAMSVDYVVDQKPDEI